MWNLKCGTNEPIYKTNRLVHIEDRLVVVKGEGESIEELSRKTYFAMEC